ncbi:sialidase family protein [Actinophytocola sediminis]
MPDVDDRFAGLRESMYNAVPLPDPGTVAQRYRRRRTRRQLQAGAVVAVLMISALVTQLPLRDSGLSFGSPPGTTPGGPEQFVTDVQFAADGSGYALRTHFSDAEGYDRPFAHTLLAATDQENWTEVGPVPIPERGDVALAGDLVVLGPNELVVDFVNIGRRTSSRSARVHSGDGGRTWQEVPMPAVVTDTVPAIPEGAQLRSACAIEPVNRPRCETPTFTVVQPGTGASAVLAAAPPLVTPMPGVIPTAAGHWWALGQVPGTSAWAISVSTDDGRTWTTSELDIDVPNARASVVSQGGSLYASIVNHTMDGVENGLRAILRSDDDGRTWQRTWEAAEEQRIELTSELVAAEDGTLKVHASPDRYTVTDDGRTLTRDGQPSVEVIHWTRAGYVATKKSSYLLSTDGISWRDHQVPSA